MEYDFTNYDSLKTFKVEPLPYTPDFKREEILVPILPLESSVYNNKFERIGTRCGDKVFDTLGSQIGQINGLNHEILGDYGEPTGYTCSPTGFINHKPMQSMPLPGGSSPFTSQGPLPRYPGW